MSSPLSISVEFKGGIELLFSGKTKIDIQLPANAIGSSGDDQWNLKRLIDLLRDDYLQERPELFIEHNTVRPGILVLVNDTDWEILGGENYQLKNNDNVLFISTLHGG